MRWRCCAGRRPPLRSRNRLQHFDLASIFDRAREKQDGNNQVNIISSTADRQAAAAFAQAKALRPTIVGATLQQISVDPEVLHMLFDVLEMERLIENKGEITLIPAKTGELLPQLLVSSPIKL